MTLCNHTDFVTPLRPARQPLQPVPLHRAEDLTHGGQLANIELSGQIYSLRITRAGKLILTK